MTGLRRNLGLLVAFTALSTGALATPVQDIDQDFKQGVELLRRGKVRRTNLYYLRGLSGKAARIKERERGRRN